VQKECFASAEVKGSKLVQKRGIAEHMQLPPVRIFQHLTQHSLSHKQKRLGMGRTWWHFKKHFCASRSLLSTGRQAMGMSFLPDPFLEIIQKLTKQPTRRHLIERTSGVFLASNPTPPQQNH
jgi:hypothetical protein